jgi:hypothetical protein
MVAAATMAFFLLLLLIYTHVDPATNVSSSYISTPKTAATRTTAGGGTLAG